MSIPKHLVEQIRSGKAVLFLGAGASFGSFHPQNKKPPSGDQLGKLIAENFLGSEFANRPLAQVAELAINESNLFEVQEFVAEVFQDFGPADFHKLIPNFFWGAIVSTNYDLVIERAYDSKSLKQKLVSFIKNTDKIEEKLRSPNSLIFIKLHGSITDISDEKVPLILTPDQYATHRKGRNFLFERVQALAANYPFVFVGSSLSDIDLRQILLDLEEVGEAKPRSYIVSPNSTPVDDRFWESKKITHLSMSFEAFLKEIDAAIPEPTRGLISIVEEDVPIRKFFQSGGLPEPSEGLKNFLSRDIEFVYEGLKSKQVSAKDFYKGYFIDWTPILNQYDVRRSLVDDLMGDVVLLDENEKTDNTEFILIKGHAGSGKSVVLRRVAWESATTFNKLCLWLNRSSFPEYEPIAELYRLTKERIYLFVDKVNLFTQFLEEAIQKSRRDKVPLTIVATERNNEWNDKCEVLQPLVSAVYDMKNLSESEIEDLLGLLARHNSLGHLATLSHDEQKSALSAKAGRQLLVALYEATSGRLFSDIVADEFNSISSVEAKSLYLSVCVLHRLGIPVRAGLISRVHNISFRQFEEKLFQPLEFIVYGAYNQLIKDVEYRSRHPLIAEMVFERILNRPQARYDEYLRLLSALDLGYKSDLQAFNGLTNSKNLLKLFPDQAMIRQLYEAAAKRVGDDAFLLQQQGIFEMNSPDGSLSKSTDFLERARKKAPHSKAILHSLAVLSSRKSEVAENSLERTKERNKSKEIARSLISSDPYSSHPYHTLIKVEVDELFEISKEASEAVIEQRVKEIERLVSSAKQAFPDDAFIASAEADFYLFLENEKRALDALKRGFSNNKRSQYLAISLAKIYKRLGQDDEAIGVLRESLDASPVEHQSLHFNIALLLSEKKTAGNRDELGYHLKRSFTPGDKNLLAHFMYGRFLYTINEFEDSKSIFDLLKEARVASNVRDKARDVISHDGEPVVFSGTILKVEFSYCFVQRDRFGDHLFSYKGDTEQSVWKKLGYSKRVVFNIGFNYKGPLAVNLKLE